MAENTKPNSFALISEGFGLSFDNEIEGRIVSAVKKTNTANVFQFTTTDKDGKDPRAFFVGKKSIEEGIVTLNEAGAKVIAPGFETYDMNGKMMVRNKERANNLDKLAVVE